MTEPFLGEVKLWSLAFAPRGWAYCNGAEFAIAQNQALYSLLGTQFGGNGQTTFRLPDLRGRTPIHAGNLSEVGEAGGEASHTLSVHELPDHGHLASGTSDHANTIVPGDALLAQVDPNGLGDIYATGPPGPQMAPDTIGQTGEGHPHENQQPFLTLNFCIAIQGIYPSRN